MSIPATGLDTIILKVRKITGRPSPNQISDTDIREYIDTYYLYDFPQEFKSFNLKTTYTFQTQPNVDTYTFPRNEYYSIDNPLYCSGFPISLFEDKELFYRTWPQILYNETFATTDGINATFTGNTTQFPVLTSSVTLSVNDGSGTNLIANDTGTGIFIGDGTGTINYLTGAISITWLAIPPAGNPINIQYFPYVASRPLALLFFHDQFIVRPIPDLTYTISMNAYIKPTALLTTESPYLDEWFELLAYGASLKIFAENMDMNNYQLLLPIYQQKFNECQRRTIMQIKNQRSTTIYGDSTFINPYRLPTV